MSQDTKYSTNKKTEKCKQFSGVKTINRDKPQDDPDVRINIGEFLKQVL